MIRTANPADAQALCRIYNHYVEGSIATFEEEAVGVREMMRRISSVLAGFPWLVVMFDDEPAGYAYAASWRERSAYRYSAETTIYMAPDRLGLGLGAALYQALIDELRARGFHRAIASISLPNAASVRLHEKLGFEKAGELREVGRKFGRWIDVAYWELTL